LNTQYEVEIRCHFQRREEALETLPFLKACLEGRAPFSWRTRFFGQRLFRSGELLRVAEVSEGDSVRRYLGWKGRDIGSFANIRQEIDEEVTGGISNSRVLNQIGGTDRSLAASAVVEELDSLGHGQFMSFHGVDLTGYEPELDLKVKLMTCPILKWPLIVELEKTATNEEDARRRETELQRLSTRFGLQTRLVRKEPPTLLYEQLFGH
jgi:hypothetical protein